MENAPGFVTRQRKNGPVYYWIASQVVRDTKGFAPKSTRIFGDNEAMARRCRVLTGELKLWLGNVRGETNGPYSGSVASAIGNYRLHEQSPYRDLRHSTRKMYDHTLNLLEKHAGNRMIAEISGIDLLKWYKDLRKPADIDGPERIKRAYGVMQLLRIVVKFGKICGHDDCARLAGILSDMRFEQPSARDQFLTFEQSHAIIESAISIGRISIALAQALQFDLTLRQVDVIGEWIPSHGPGDGIVFNGNRWTGGLRWSDMRDGILSKTTTKRGVEAIHNVAKYPSLQRVLDLVPMEQRIGPMVMSEITGRPYKRNNYAKTWREIARVVGVPDNVWNRDSRSGGVTEGFDAGAELESMRQHANHIDAKMTSRYNRKTLQQSENVADLRAAYRSR